MDTWNTETTLDALALRAELQEISPLIEAFTASVCPGCPGVCCIDRHGTPERDDELFMEALGAGPPALRAGDDDTAPCRYLGRRGCTLARWERPYRCTWYFCAPLLEAMAGAEPRKYRALVGRLGRLQALRAKFLEGAADTD